LTLTFPASPANSTPAWPRHLANAPELKVLTVDDDVVFRRSMAFALEGYQFQGRDITLLQAGSAAQARALLVAHPDIALLLLDVVMENDDDGLMLVRHVREGMGRRDIRIVLLTGQPGMAPMRDVMRNLDVNEYWHKTELGSDRLEAILNANLRSHQFIQEALQTRRQLEQLLAAVDGASHVPDLTGLSQALLVDVARLLGLPGEGLVVMWPAHTTAALVIGATGRFAELQGRPLDALGDPAQVQRIEQALTHRPGMAAAPAHALDLLMPLHPSSALSTTASPGRPDDLATLFALWMPRRQPPAPNETEMVQLLVANVGAQMHRLELIAKLDRLAYHDPLTELPNRNGLLRMMHAAGERLSTMVLQFEDVDQFSNLNLMLGFETTNRLLQALAQRLRDEAGPEVLVARMDNDTFALLGPRDKLDTPLHRHRSEGITVSDGHFSAVLHLTGARVDLALFSGPPEEILATARYLLNDAKRRGWGQEVAYRPGMEAAARDNYRLGQALHEALRAGEIRIALQPQVWLRDGTLKGFEALARWTDRRGQEVSPVTFIALAEASGHITALFTQVLQQSCHAWRVLEALGLGHLRIAVNLSALQLAAPTLAQDIADQCADQGVPPEAIELEVTESAVMLDPDGAAAQLARLRQLGFEVALDDFGTGFSSLARLRSFDLDWLKIDRAFLGEIGQRPDHETLPDMIVTLSRQLGLKSLAEGVETDAQRLWLVRSGCMAAQGLLFGAPMPVAALPDWLRTHGHLPAQPVTAGHG
jgi:EAL domain-containing protein (putative c-di-GMP-specific phosphodiesterase class I)/GGDEF domain-containing protein/ActR/RegA family two-component response regulator